MTRKDYELFADMLAELSRASTRRMEARYTVKFFCEGLARVLAERDQRFSVDKFLKRVLEGHNGN